MSKLIGFFRLLFEQFRSADRRVRKRLFIMVLLLMGIGFLVAFDVHMGFTSWENIQSNTIVFVAINLNILLMITVAYLILKNLVKLMYERNQQILGVNLKTKLIVAFILISFPATLSHLFTGYFTTYTLENWLQQQYTAVNKSADLVVDSYHRTLRVMLENQTWILTNFLQQNPDAIHNSEKIKELIEETKIEGVVIYDYQQSQLYQDFNTHKSSKYWKPLSEVEWEQVLMVPTNWLAEDIGNRLLYRFITRFEVEGETYYLEMFHPATKRVSGALDNIDVLSTNTLVFLESEDLLKHYSLISVLFMALLIVFVAIWFAFYMARGFVRPIEQLAEATHQVAMGEYGYEVGFEKGLPLDQDFAKLMEAFNTMSHQLKENHDALQNTKEHLEQTNLDLEKHTLFVHLVLENIKTGVVSLDIHGHVNILNHAAKQLMELRREDFVDRHYRDVLQDKSLELFEAMMEEMEATGTSNVSRDMMIMQEDSPIQVSMTLFSLVNREGKKVGLVCVYENITEIQRYSRARAWREVARRIAHEIKNPLTPIQLSAQRLRRKYLNKIQDDQVLDSATNTIINEVESLKRMVMEFSQFARLPESHPENVSLNQVVLDAISLYSNALPAEITIQTELAEQLPELSLDKEQFKRVFVNLIDNAIMAMENRGTILLKTQFRPELRIVQAEVIDDGPGVDPSIQRRMFEPYATTKKTGTGLGLTIVLQIISDHNGFIRQQNLKPHGSNFTIELPIS